MSCCERCTVNDEEEKRMLSDDQILDARDMAEEMEQAHADYYETAMVNDPELTTCKHDGMKKPCIFGCDDEAVLNDIDAVVEQVAQPRTFETLINEWTEACRAENDKLPNELAVVAAACPAFLRLSALGMRLIYESNSMGMRQVMDMTKEKLSGGL